MLALSCWLSSLQCQGNHCQQGQRWGSQWEEGEAKYEVSSSSTLATVTMFRGKPRQGKMY